MAEPDMFDLKAYVVNCKIWRQFQKLSKSVQGQYSYLWVYAVLRSSFLVYNLDSSFMVNIETSTFLSPVFLLIHSCINIFLPSHLRGRSDPFFPWIKFPFTILSQTIGCWYHLILPFHPSLCFLIFPSCILLLSL